MLAFNAALSLVTGLLFGLVPALRSTGPNLASTLKDEAGAAAGGRSRVRFRKALVIGQVTLSLLLLASAGLFIRSLRNLQLLSLGMSSEHVIAFNINPTLSGYTPVRTKLFNRLIAEKAGAAPGITGVAFANIGLLEGNEWDSSITIEGYEAKPGEQMNPYFNAVSPGYFKTMRIPLLQGRDFDDRDVGREAADQSSSGFPPPYTVAIVNESCAKHYFGDRSPVGHHIGFGIDPGTKTPIEIIGVVGDAKYTGVRDQIPRQVFVPFLQNDFAGGSVLYVRAADPGAALASIRRIVRDLDATVPVYGLRTLDHQIELSLRNDRIIATLSTAFAILATALAMIGLYGVMAYTVAQRTREIGVRVALGAAAGDVVWLVMREVLWLAGSGIVLGLSAVIAVSRFLQSQLYEIAPNDPLTMAGAAITLFIVALLAGYVPARRGTRVNPVLALKYE